MGVNGNWTSFPSDTAVLFSALAAGITRAWPALGVVASLHTGLIVLAPRLYLGLHYPSDLLAGALVGATAVWTLTMPALRGRLTRWTSSWRHRYPGVYYAALFLVSLQVATLFWDVRQVVALGYGLAQAIAARWF